MITTVAGTGSPGYTGDNGFATAAKLNFPFDVALDASGNLYIADTVNHVIRLVTKIGGLITTVAGTGSPGYTGDNGFATAAKLNLPFGIALDASGNLYIADTYNHVIRLVTKIGGLITTVAGTGFPGYTGDNGFATAAKLNFPEDVALDASGNLYIADTHNHVIRLVTNIGGLITTVAGTGSPGYTGDNGFATAAKLNLPHRTALDASGNLYIADGDNQRIRLVYKLQSPTVSSSLKKSPVSKPHKNSPKASKCDKKSKTCRQGISNVEVDDILVNSIVSEFPASRRL